MADFLNDEPTVDDLVGIRDLVVAAGEAVARSDPPHVFGVHGDWGAGKTSFLNQVQLYLTGECPPLKESRKPREMRKSGWGESWAPKNNVLTVWFEAWRYQHESAPIVALLQEMRSQLSWQRKTWQETKKLFEVAAESALMSLDSITKMIGAQSLPVSAATVRKVGEKWETENLASRLPSYKVREHLEHAISELLGGAQKKRPAPRLVVLIDDLDRCSSRAAYRLLEGIKIYLNLPSCVFLLGMNQRIIEDAIAKEMARGRVGAAPQHQAREYVEKLCHNIWHLPLVAEPDGLLAHWLPNVAEKTEILGAVLSHHCLPPNARKIKAFANVLRRFFEYYDAEPGDFKPAERADPRHAQLTVLMASLYLYHHDLYRLVQADRKFFERIADYARSGNTDHEVLKRYKPVFGQTEKPGRPEEREPIPPEAAEPTFPDPVSADVLRIQSLVRDLGVVTEEELLRYLLRR